MVLERWDLSIGQRTIVPVIDEQENPIEVNRDRSIFHYRGVQVGDEYRFISEDGDAFTVDLTSGRGRYLFSHTMEDSSRVLFQVTETASTRSRIAGRSPRHPVFHTVGERREARGLDDFQTVGLSREAELSR